MDNRQGSFSQWKRVVGGVCAFATIGMLAILGLVPTASASTQESWSKQFYARADLYQAAMSASGRGIARAGIGGPHNARSNRVPLDILVTNNGTETRSFKVRCDYYRQPSIASGYGSGETVGGFDRDTPPLAPGQQHRFSGADFAFSLMLFYLSPGTNAPNTIHHHSFPPAGSPPGSQPDDGEHVVLDNVYGSRYSLANLGGSNSGQVVDRTNLEIRVTGEIDDGGYHYSNEPYFRTIELAAQGNLPTLQLFANPTTAPDRAGAILEDDLTGCGCESNSVCTTAAVDSLDYTFGLPTEHFDQSPAFRLKADAPHPKITDPSALQVDPELDSEKLPGTQTLRQISSSSQIALIDIADADDYTISFYHLADAGTSDANGIYSDPTGSAHTTVRIEDPDPGNGDRQVKFTRTSGTDIEVSHYTYTPADDRWELSTADGQRIEKMTTTESLMIPDLETETREITDAAGTTITKVASDYYDFAFGRRMISRTVDPDGRSRTTTYDYYGDGDGIAETDPNYGELHYMITPTGHWTHYEYDEFGRAIKVVTPYGDAPIAPENYDGSQDASLRVAQHLYDDFPITQGVPHETHFTTLLGHEISRSYLVKHQDGEDNIVAVAPAAPHTDAGNLITKRRWHTSGSYKFEPTRVERPDGTVSLYSYSSDPSNQQRTTTVSDGQPAADDLSIVKGTSTVTVTSPNGTVLSATTSDIETGLQLSRTAATTTDTFGRATTTSALDVSGNAFATTTVNFDCCGVANTTDRTGIYTEYDNSADLASAQISLGIRTTTAAESVARGGGGRVETVDRVAIDGQGDPIPGTSTLLQRREYDTAGYLVTEYAPPVNADSDPAITDLGARRATSFTDVIDPANGHRTRTVIAPDTSTAISESYADGRIRKISGTGTRHSRFEYGIEIPPGTSLTAMRFTKTILLKKDGTDSGEWSKSYTDNAGRTPLSVTSTGATTTTGYNSKGQMTSQSDPDGITILYAYDDRGRPEITAQDIDRDGNIDYDGTDRITRTSTTPSQRMVDGDNLVTLVTTTTAWINDNDPNTTAEFSRFESSTNGLHTWSSAEGLETHIETSYAGSGNSTSTTTYPDGTKTENLTLAGRLRSVTEFDNTGATTSSTTYDYDDLGRGDATTDARNGTTTLAFYIDDRIKSTTTPDPDGVGQETARTSSITYDIAGRRHATTLPDHSVADPKVITHNYHPTGELHESSGARAYATTYTYDFAGRMETLTAGAGTTTWNYFADSGFLENKLYADNKGTSFTHTLAGRPQTRTLARGIHRKTAYDNSGLPKSVSYFTDNTETTADPLTPDTVYSYDRLANLRTLTDAAGLHTFTTTPTGRTELETITGGLLAGTTLDPAYDALLRRHSLSFSTLGAGDLIHSYRYDASGRFEKIAAGADPDTSPSATYTHHADSNLPNTTTSRSSSGATRLTLTRNFDAINRLTSITNLGAGSTAPLDTSHTFEHNAAAQRERITLADGSYWEYAYDSQFGHLESATKHLPDGTAIASQTHSFDHDNIGNRVGSGGTTPTRETYTPNDLNQYDQITQSGTHWINGTADPAATVSVDGNPTSRPGNGAYFEFEAAADNSSGNAMVEHEITSTLGGKQDSASRFAIIAAATAVPEYDDDGNLTSDGIYDYTWDGEDRLITIQTRADTLPASYPHHRLEFAYDSGSRRIEKKVYGIADAEWKLANHKRFLYDGWNLLAEYEPKMNDTWHTTTSYLWGKDLSGSLQGAGGTAGLLHIRDHLQQSGHFVAYDGKGNVSALVDQQTGATSAEYDYTPFGKLAAATGPAAHRNPFRFSSRYCDSETGLYYYGYRYYDPKKGRWLNRDPIGESGGLNLYGFVENDSVNRWDRLGLEEGCKALKEALLAAHLAEAAYGVKKPPSGWREIIYDAVHNDSGLDVAIFRGPNGETVIAFRGTTERNDWVTNAVQGAGLIGRQYKESLIELEKLARKYPTASVVGHSLGGGLASVFGTRHGRRTTTFNAAGLHSRTLSAFGVDRADSSLLVTAYYVRGEILSGLQDGSQVAGLVRHIPTDGIPTAVGRRVGLKANLDDNVREFGLRDFLNPLRSSFRRAGDRFKLPVDLHLMDEVIEALGKKIKKCCDE